MINLPIVLHIGYHKTGTTFLQKKVFSQHSEIIYLGQPFSDHEIGKLCRALKFEHDFDFDGNEIKHRIANRIEELYSSNISHKKSILISLESLHSGYEWFGRDVVNMSYRLKKVFPDAKIVIGIRDKIEYIESNYKEYVIHGGKIDFNSFLFQSFLCNKCLLPKLRYDKIINLYSKLFNNNVCIYNHNDLRIYPEKQVSRLLNFIGVDFKKIEISHDIVYGSMAKTASEFIRYMNILIAKDFIEQYYDVGVVSRLSKLEKFRRRMIKLVKIIDAKLKMAHNSTYIKETHRNYINNYFKSNK